MLEGDLISLSGGESDMDLLGPDFGLDPKEDLNTTRTYSIIDELMDGPPAHRTNHSSTRETTTPAHTQITTTTTNKLSTTHILKTLRQHTTVTITSTSTSPPLPKISPPSAIPHQSSTTTSKPITTSSNQTIPPSEHLPFTFYFIPNRRNYISKLNLSTNLAKLCTDIQRNAESSIIKLVENYLSKQQKHKKKKKRTKKKKKKKNLSIQQASTTNPGSLQRNTNPFHQSPPHQTALLLPPTPPEPHKLPHQDSTSTLPPQPHNTPNHPRKAMLPRQPHLWILMVA